MRIKVILLSSVLVLTGMMVGCSVDDACAAPGSGTGSYRTPPPAVRVSPTPRYSPPRVVSPPRVSSPRVVTPAPAPRSPSMPPVIIVPMPSNGNRC